MQKSFFFSILVPIFFTIFISIFFIPHIVHSIEETGVNVELIISNKKYSFNTSNASSNFLWPTPNYKTITSSFGYRKSPTTGASSYHGGIDIGAPQGTKILAIESGTITYVGWNGANGYTVMIDHGGGYKSIYGHVNPNFVVSVGDIISKGEHIANVGPKYVETKSYTTYKDSSGNSTNGATTGPHLHLAISKDGVKIDPSGMF